MDPRWRCSECGFELWLPIAELTTGVLGLYNDARFPGRCIFALREHHEDLAALSDSLLFSYAREATRSASAIRIAVGSSRINYAVLGNAEPHVHFHLIPRFPETEPKPRNSPWDDPRPKAELTPSELRRIRYAIGEALELRSADVSLKDLADESG